MSPVCEGVVVRTIRLLEEARRVAKGCGERVTKVEDLMDETTVGAVDEDEKKTTVQLRVIFEMLRDLRDTLMEKRAAMIEPLRDVAG